MALMFYVAAAEYVIQVEKWGGIVPGKCTGIKKVCNLFLS